MPPTNNLSALDAVELDLFYDALETELRLKPYIHNDIESDASTAKIVIVGTDNPQTAYNHMNTFVSEDILENLEVIVEKDSIDSVLEPVASSFDKNIASTYLIFAYKNAAQSKKIADVFESFTGMKPFVYIEDTFQDF